MTGTVSSTNRRMTSPAPRAHAALGKQVRAMKTMRSSRYVNERLLTLAWRSKAAVPLSTRNRPFATLPHVLNERPFTPIAARKRTGGFPPILL